MPPATSPPLRDTPQTYGIVSRALHWAVAALLLCQIGGMVLRKAGAEGSFVNLLTYHHGLVGTLLWLLIAARLIWALCNARNRPAHRGPLARFVSAGHGILYAVMLAIPTLGLLRAWGSTRGLSLLGVQIFPPRAVPVEWTATLAGALHGELAWLLTALVAGHVLMVGLHEGLWRDGTLGRMAGRIARRP